MSTLRRLAVLPAALTAMVVCQTANAQPDCDPGECDPSCGLFDENTGRFIFGTPLAPGTSATFIDPTFNNVDNDDFADLQAEVDSKVQAFLALDPQNEDFDAVGLGWTPAVAPDSMTAGTIYSVRTFDLSSFTNPIASAELFISPGAALYSGQNAQALIVRVRAFIRAGDDTIAEISDITSVIRDPGFTLFNSTDASVQYSRLNARDRDCRLTDVTNQVTSILGQGNTNSIDVVLVHDGASNNQNFEDNMLLQVELLVDAPVPTGCVNAIDPVGPINPVQGLDYDFVRIPGFTSESEFFNELNNPNNFINSGTTTGLDIEAETGVFPFIDNSTNNDLGYIYSGFLKVDFEAEYEFSISQIDDAARVTVAGQVVSQRRVFNGEQISPRPVLCLGEGYHPIKVEYVEAGGGAELEVSRSINGGSFGVIPNFAFFRPDIDCNQTDIQDFLAQLGPEDDFFDVAAFLNALGAACP